MDVVFLTDNSGVFQRSATWQSVGTSDQSGAARQTVPSQTGSSPDSLKCFCYLIECRAARGADDDGEGRLQSP